MNLEEKSREYADNKLQTRLSQIIPENSDNDEEIMFARHVERYDSYDIEQAYEDGYNEALNSQWKDPKVLLPEEDEWVDVCICRYDGSIKYRFEAMPDHDYGYVMPEACIYRVQTHKRFLGVTYWKTIVETTDYFNARTAFI